MLKPDKRLIREILVPVALQLAIIGYLLISSIRSGLSLGTFFFALLTYALCSFLLSGEIRRAITAIRRLRRGEQRRQAAVVNASVATYWPQPIPHPAALPLPFTISFRPKGVSYLLLLLFAVLVLAFWVVRIGWWHEVLDPLAPIVVGLGLLYSLSELFSLHQQIEVNETGMTVRSPFRQQTILWQEARLFAVDVLARNNQIADRYELSSATTTLRWSRKLKPSRFTRLSSPFPEYSRQMDALLSLIVGKTNLPLFDLRDNLISILPTYPSHVAIAQE